MKKRADSTVAPRASAKVPEDIVNDLLGALRGQFYGDRDEKRWWVERPLLLKAVTYPAWRLHSRGGAGLPWGRYQAIVFEVMQTIKHHGSHDRARNFGAYFLKAVQTHMDHHAEEYLADAKRAAHQVDAVLMGIQAAAGVDSTVADLAALHGAVTPKGGRPKKPAPADQPTLF